jgi:hypothetical protein
MKAEFSLQIFDKYSSMKTQENLSSESRAFPFVETDRQTDRHDEANSRFSQFWERV